MYGNEIKDKLDHYEERLVKILQIFLSIRSDLDPVQLFRIRPDPDSQL
jgi:hypothetical protein